MVSGANVPMGRLSPREGKGLAQGHMVTGPRPLLHGCPPVGLPAKGEKGFGEGR